MLTIDGTCLIVFLSFFVFMLIMKPLFFDPMLQLKQQRETHIQSGEVAAQQAQEKSQQLHTDFETKMGEARHKAQQIIQEKRDQARSKANERLDQSRQTVMKQHQSELAQLEASQEEAYNQLSQQRDEMVKLIAQKVMVSFEQAVSSKS